jgi:hypothetical protein
MWPQERPGKKKRRKVNGLSFLTTALHGVQESRHKPEFTGQEDL